MTPALGMRQDISPDAFRASSSSSIFFTVMVSQNSSNERPQARVLNNTKPPRNRNPMFWSIYSNTAVDDDEPPAVPPKDFDHNPTYISPVSSSTSLDAYTRPRYTSFSAYESQSANMAFPEPQRHRLGSKRSILGFAQLVRHRGSKSETGLGASTASLWRPDSNQESNAVTVFTPFDPL